MSRVRGHANVVEMHEWFEDRTGFFVVCEVSSNEDYRILMDGMIL